MIHLEAEALDREQSFGHGRSAIGRERQSALEKRLAVIDVDLGDIAAGKPSPFVPHQLNGGRNFVVFGGERSDDQAFVGQRLKPRADRVDQAAFL